MFPRPGNAAFLLGIGAPHYFSSNAATVMQQCTSLQSKAFYQSAAAILANPACTDSAAWITGIVQKKMRDRAVTQPDFVADVQRCVDRFRGGLTPSTAEVLDSCVAVLRGGPHPTFPGGNHSSNSNANINNNNDDDDNAVGSDDAAAVVSSSTQQQLAHAGPFGTVMLMLSIIEKAAEQTSEVARVKEAEARVKVFKQANRVELDKIYGKAPPKPSASSASAAASSTQQQQQDTAPPLQINIHVKASETNLNFVRVQMTALRDETERLREEEKNTSAPRLLHRSLSEVLDAAKARSGLALVEKWQAERDSERSKAGGFFGDLVEEEAWRQSVPFLIAATADDASLGSKWQALSFDEKLKWFARCQTCELTDEEIEQAERCTCPKCLERNPAGIGGGGSGTTPPLTPPHTPVSENSESFTSPCCENDNNDSNAAAASAAAEMKKPQQRIKNPQRDHSTAREQFKMFRRYCWKIKMPFLRIFTNVGYTAPKGSASAASSPTTPAAAAKSPTSTTSGTNANTKPPQQQQQRGELDGILVNICHSREAGLAVLACIEVKHNASDLVYARAQRERFVSTLRQARSAMIFSNKDGNEYGRHCELNFDRFESVFLRDPNRRWIFVTVGDKHHLSLPFYSKISHIFFRSMVACAAHNTEQVPDLPPCPAELVNSATAGNSAASAASRRGRGNHSSSGWNVNDDEAAEGEEKKVVDPSSSLTPAQIQSLTNSWLSQWIEAVRSFFTRGWLPSDDECRRITAGLHKAWEQTVAANGGPTLMLPPTAVLAEDDAIRQQQQAQQQQQTGCVAWIDLTSTLPPPNNKA